MDEANRLYSLFGYETQGGRKSPLWENQHLFLMASGQAGKMLDESFADWGAAKRALTEEELLKGEWSKVGDHGLSFRVKFLPDGKFIERNVSTDDSWEGSWKFVGKALRMKVGKYELDIIGNKEGDTHSGVEIADGKLHAYFTLTHEDNDPLGIR